MGLGLHRDHAAERRMLLPFAPPCRYDLPRSLPRNDARGMAGRTDGVVLDGSGSHRGAKVAWPEGIVPIPLPPYSPELNPAEQIFRHLRKRLANVAFATIEELKDALTRALQRLWDHPKVIIRMTNYPWWREGVTAITPPLS